MALQPAFIWGAGGKRMTPDEIARERQLLEALSGQTDTSPVSHWTQGAARVADAIGGVVRERRADRDEAQNNSESQTRIASLLAGIGGGGASAPSPTPQPSTSSLMAPGNAQPGGMTSYRDAIASIESAGSGDYAAVGPTHPRLGRALGRYQVMEANIGPWSEKHLGRRVSADEFMADPALQDAIFDAEFGTYVQRYGPEGAAQAWFGGPGGVGKTDRRDSLGTSIGAYGEKFNRALGTQPNADMGLATSAAMASADPMQALNTRNVVEDPRAVTMPEIAEGVGQYVPQSGFIGANSDMPSAITYDEQGMRPAGAPAPLADDAFNDRFGGSPQPAQAFDAVMPNDPMQTSAMPAPAPPVDPLRAEVQQLGTSLGSAQLANADPRQGILQALLAGGNGNPQGEFPPAPGQQQAQMGGGLSPAIIEALSNPNASPQERQIAGVMLQQQMSQQAAQQERQAEMADPSYQMDLERQRLELEQLRTPEQRDLINAGDGRLYDPNQGRWITAPGADEPTSRPMTAEERQQWGIPQDGSPWAMTPDGPEQLVDGPLVTNNIGNGDKFVEESDKAAAARINEVVAQGNSASQFLGDVQQLGALGAQIQTGRGAQVVAQLGPWAQMVGVDIESLGPSEAYNAIVARLAPQMRPAGSGATSDFDARQFLQALPSLGNTPDGNAIIIGTFEAIQQNKLQAAEIGSLALIPQDQGGITWQEAEKRIRALPNPYERFKEVYGQPEGSQGGNAGGDVPEGVDPADWEFMSEEDRALFR